jgi:hypothetical protein
MHSSTALVRILPDSAYRRQVFKQRRGKSITAQSQKKPKPGRNLPGSLKPY